jgi:glycine oxidase
VLVAFGDADRGELDEVEKLFAGNAGFATARLGAPALRGIDARLSADIVEGLRIEGNESIDSAAYNRALVEGAGKAGARIVRAEVLGVERRAARISSLATQAGPIACDCAVFATGPWVAEVGRWLGLELRVEPVKGEMLRMRLPPPNVTHDFTHGLISLYRRGADEVWVGVTRERCGFDETPTAEARRVLIDGAARILPAVRSAMVLEQLASLRPMTPSGLPVVGRAPGWDNVFITNGGGIKGVLLSTGIGSAVRDLVMTGQTALPIQEFSL